MLSALRTELGRPSRAITAVTLVVIVLIYTVWLTGGAFHGDSKAGIRRDPSLVLVDLANLLDVYRLRNNRWPTARELSSMPLNDEAEQMSLKSVRLALDDESLALQIVPDLNELQGECPADLLIVGYISLPAERNEFGVLTADGFNIVVDRRELDARLRMMSIIRGLIQQREPHVGTQR